MRFNNLKLVLLALVAVALVAAPSANATTVSATSGSNTISLTFDLTGTTLKVDSFTLNGTTVPTGTGKLLAVGVSGTTFATLPTGWSINSPTTCDGLGSCQQASGPQSAFFTSALTFTLNGTPTDLFFHVGGFTFTSCSVWLESSPTGGTAVGTSGLDECGGTHTVPEPGTLGLLGTGLVGIGGLVRRRFLS